jgi:4-amino-4-deoxy-L-arabinose transferase-like glycosyltransferase
MAFAVILGVAFLVRTGWVILAARRALVGDAVAYTYHGEQLARGQGYRSFVAAFRTLTPAERSGDFPPTAFYPIGYPAVLAVVFWIVFHTPIADDLPRAVGSFQLVLGVATVAAVMEISRHLFGTRVALLAGAIVAVFPSLVFYTAATHLETVFIFLVMVAVLVVITAPWPRLTRKRLLLFGLALGLSALVRPLSLIVLPALALAWALDGLSWRRTVAQLAWTSLAVAIVISPWLVRNAIVMKSPVFSTGIGDALCDSRHEGAKGYFEIAEQYCLAGYEHLPLDEQEVKRNRENTRKAFEFVIHHPADEARLMFWRGYYAYRDDHEMLLTIDADPTHPLRGSKFVPVLETLSDFYYVTVVALALLGLPLFLRGRETKRVFLVLVGMGMAATPFLLFGDPRYHVPVLPFLAIGAAATLARLVPSSDAGPHRVTDGVGHAP